MAILDLRNICSVSSVILNRGGGAACLRAAVTPGFFALVDAGGEGGRFSGAAGTVGIVGAEEAAEVVAVTGVPTTGVGVIVGREGGGGGVVGFVGISSSTISPSSNSTISPSSSSSSAMYARRLKISSTGVVGPLRGPTPAAARSSFDGVRLRGVPFCISLNKPPAMLVAGFGVAGLEVAIGDGVTDMAGRTGASGASGTDEAAGWS